MTHSVRNCHKVQRLQSKLRKRVKALHKLVCKRFKNPTVIELPDVSLGDLRRRFKPYHYKLHPAVMRQVSQFERIPADPINPLLIYGSDGGILGCRQANVYMIQFRLCLLISTMESTEGSMWPGIIVYGLPI